jgi:sigma-B regulation protein RsbQ
MNLQARNNVNIYGDGPATLVFVHGFGCDQTMWRWLAPLFEGRYRMVMFDLVGSGRSDLSAYDYGKYGSLDGYAADVVEIVREFASGPVILVGHSVSAMIGLLASIEAPELFAAQIMVAPSPCYINDGDYVGGFAHSDIDDLLLAMEANYLGWSSTMAPAIMGAPDAPQLGAELTNSFCRTNPDIARHFARVTFMSDHRAELARSRTPALVLQCTDDFIAPETVGRFTAAALPDSTLVRINNIGHCPHMSAPRQCADAIDTFLATRLQ